MPQPLCIIIKVSKECAAAISSQFVCFVFCILLSATLSALRPKSQCFAFSTLHDSTAKVLPRCAMCIHLKLDCRILVLGQELPAVKASERSSESRGSQYLAGYQQIESNKKVRFPGKCGRW